MKIKDLLLSFSFLYLAMVSALAQPNKPAPFFKHPELQAETQAYVQKNILPVLQEQRQKLEKIFHQPIKNKSGI